MPREETIEIIVRNKTATARIRKWHRRDIKILRKALHNWGNLVKFLKKYASRRTNLPELISEALFCIYTGSVQVLDVKNVGKGFDCYNEKTKKTQQIKGSSRRDSPSSFGPHEKFDEVYWVVIEETNSRFKFEIYKLSKKSVVTHPSFRPLAREGRRPRFLLLDIVRDKKLRPIAKGYI